MFPWQQTCILSYLQKKRGGDSRHFGDEIDLTLNYKYSKHASVTGGISNVFQKEASAAIGRLTEDFLFGYLMVNVAF